MHCTIRLYLYSVCSALLLVSAIGDKVSFENVKVQGSIFLRGLVKIDPVTGSLEPSKGLERVTFITVRAQSVPALYTGAVKNLNRLYSLELSNDNIEEIESGAFQNLSTLNELNLKDNKIAKIREDVFNNLNIRRLNLASNKISVIERRALNDLPNLRVLQLDYNEVSKWNPDWFFNSPRLLMLHFSNNKIEKLPPRAFKNYKGIENMDDGWYPPESHVDLSSNRISIIDAKAFEGVKQLDVLDLQNNRLTSDLQPGIFSPIEKAQSILLLHNKIQCLSEEFFHSLPHGLGIAKRAFRVESNPWNCTCLNKLISWSNTHGNIISVRPSEIDCLVETVEELRESYLLDIW